jgi:hypothetical protein
MKTKNDKNIPTVPASYMMAVHVRLKRIFEIETEFAPDVRILLAEALFLADESIHGNGEK